MHTDIVNPANVKPGDLIYAKPICRWPTRWAWRRVTGRDARGYLTIRANGFDDFALRPHEIQGHRPAS